MRSRFLWQRLLIMLCFVTFLWLCCDSMITHLSIFQITQNTLSITCMIWYDMIMIWYDMIWYGMVWYDMIMIWYDMIWYDMIYDMIYETLPCVFIWYLLERCVTGYITPNIIITQSTLIMEQSHMSNCVCLKSQPTREEQRHISLTFCEVLIQILLKNMRFLQENWMFYQVTILHMPRQLSCRGMCKIMTWYDNQNKNYS